MKSLADLKLRLQMDAKVKEGTYGLEDLSHIDLSSVAHDLGVQDPILYISPTVFPSKACRMRSKPQ